MENKNFIIYSIFLVIVLVWGIYLGKTAINNWVFVRYPLLFIGGLIFGKIMFKFQISRGGD